MGQVLVKDSAVCEILPSLQANMFACYCFMAVGRRHDSWVRDKGLHHGKSSISDSCLFALIPHAP